jgi:hypothetical protein
MSLFIVRAAIPMQVTMSAIPRIPHTASGRYGVIIGWG